MNIYSSLFYQIDEPYAAGFFEDDTKNLFFRHARAQRRYWEACPLPIYSVGSLYPDGYKFQDTYAVHPDFSFTFRIDSFALSAKSVKAAEIAECDMPQVPDIPGPHTVGGNGYTHSIPHYERIIKEGLDSYADRIHGIRDTDFREGLQEIMEGIHCYHARILSHLKESKAAEKLVSALEKVPFSPAETLYEALVCWNFIYYLDGCDNPGRLDTGLIDYYNGEDFTSLLREFFMNVDINNGWTAALGPDYNPLTVQCLQAIKGLRRPSIELRLIESAPKEVWDAATEAILSGCGQPSFYNELKYQTELKKKFPCIPQDDLLRFCGGGCTETMLAGISNVGSLDAGIHTALIFTEYIKNKLCSSLSFDDFYDGLVTEINRQIAIVLDTINEQKIIRAKLKPHPVRTLLIDDCIEKEKDFNAGGARYYWSVVNVAGLINVIDSLLAVKHIVFDTKQMSPALFLDLLEKEDTDFFQKLKHCPHYGSDDPKSDDLAATFSEKVFNAFDQRAPYLGGAFLPASIQFATYAEAGRLTGATPDGRRSGEPLCDSIGAINQNNSKGPTAFLISAAKIAQSSALGTPVLNFRINKNYIKTYLKPLITGYFRSGGMQIQINCVSKEDLLDALDHPEKHENLIVRIGGYSEYFNRLPLELKRTVLERTEYGF